MLHNLKIKIILRNLLFRLKENQSFCNIFTLQNSFSYKNI